MTALERSALTPIESYDDFFDLVEAVGGRVTSDLIRFVGTYRPPRELHVPGCQHFYWKGPWTDGGLNIAAGDQGYLGAQRLATTEEVALPRCPDCEIAIVRRIHR